MKTFVLTVSRVFPTTHTRKGQETFFPQKIDQLNMVDSLKLFQPQKIHTIRANYELWKTRIEQVQKGEAILSIRYWSEKPYRSKQVEICQLDKDSGIGVQELFFKLSSLHLPTIDTNSSGKYSVPSLELLSKNDGLSVNDFKEWFKNYDLSKSMAIIHFSAMRY